MSRFQPNMDDDYQEEEGKRKFSLPKFDGDKKPFILVSLATMLVTAGVYQFAVLPISNNSVREQTIAEIDVNAMATVPVVVLNPGAKVEKYTQLDADIINKDFTVKNVPVPFAVADPISDPVLLTGKITNSTLTENMQVGTSQLTDQTDWYGKFDRLKEYKISNTVAGQVQVGNIVDVTVDYGNGNYDVVAAKKKITRIQPNGNGNQVDANGNVQLSEQNNMVFSVNETEFANLELAKTMGTLQVRLYVDEGQDPSVVTFKPSSAAAAKAAAQAQEKEANGATDGLNN